MMERLIVVGEIGSGLYLMLPPNDFTLPSEESLKDSYRTPNKSMVKDGIDRYPFKSYDVDLKATSQIVGHGRTLYEYKPQSYRPDAVTNVSTNAIGENRSRIALGFGGVVSYYVTSFGSQFEAHWIRPGNDGWYFVNGSSTSYLYLSYYTWKGSQILYQSFGKLPVASSMQPEEVLSMIYTYEPVPTRLTVDRYPSLYFLDGVVPGNIPGNVVDRVHDAILPMVSHDEGRIGFELISQFKLTDINLPAFFMELPEFGKSTIDVLSSLKDASKLAGVKSVAKNLSKANLAYQYGDRLSVSDASELIGITHELGRQADLFGPRTAKSKDFVTLDSPTVSGVDILRYTATAAPTDPLSKGVYGLAHVFNYANVWDMIPFSFVVDWFLNFGDYLAAEDAHVLNCILTYSRIIRSRALDVKLDNFELDGSLLSGTFKYFERDKVEKVPAPNIDLQASIPRPAQWINGTSLLTSLLIK